MSSPVRTRPETQLPTPRAPGDAAVPPPAAPSPPSAADGRGSLFDRRWWLTPACAIALIIAAFGMMILLTVLAGGDGYPPR